MTKCMRWDSYRKQVGKQLVLSKLVNTSCHMEERCTRACYIEGIPVDTIY